MNKKKIFLILLFVLTSCHNEWVFRPEIRGIILGFDSNKPLLNAKIETIPIESEPVDYATSKNTGRFVLPKISSESWTFLGMEKPRAPALTNKIVIKADGYANDTVDYTNYSSKNNVIDLGEIFLKRKN